MYPILPALYKKGNSMQKTITVEVEADADGYLVNPIVFADLVVTEVGLIKRNLDGMELCVWIVPKPKPFKEEQISGVCYIQTNTDNDDLYFVGFEAKTMCDVDANETCGDSIVVKKSLRQARIFQNPEIAKKAIALLNVLEPESHWRIVQ